MKKWTFTLAGAAGLLLSAGLACAGQDTGKIHGKVTSAGAPLSGATCQIKALSKVAKTRPNGAFGFSGIPVGAHSLTCSKGGYLSATQQVQVKAGETTQVSFSLAAHKATGKKQAQTEAEAPASAAPVAAEPAKRDAKPRVAERRSRKESRSAPKMMRASGGIGRGYALGAAAPSPSVRMAAPMAMAPPPPPPGAYMIANGDAPSPEANREGYDAIKENDFRATSKEPLSTFSIDVDTAAYANVRRFLNQSRLPPAGAVRIEELINYFNYEYPGPESEPFSINTEISTAPWDPRHRLVHIGLQGKKVNIQALPPSNMVFLIDVSGSMFSANKLPLLQAGFKLLVQNMRPVDRVAIVVYAGAAGMVLPSTPGKERQKIIDALDGLRAGGSTAGGAGIKLAYKVAQENFIKGGNNRIILATDGDFNVGQSSDDELIKLIEKKRKSGVFLTILGFGMGNYQDAKMQKLADKGNGNHAYIDSILEAKKVLVSEMGGTLFTIAKDVKIQVEFNPTKVKGYRLVGYENRVMANQDFNDDKKDAGELGAGHTVTALYEIIPAGSDEAVPGVDALKYQKTQLSDAAGSNELMTIKLRYKAPDGDTSKLITHPLLDSDVALAGTSDNYRFSAAVAMFGMILRDSKHKGQSTWEQVESLATGAKGKDSEGYRAEFIQLTKKAALLKQIEK
ncbi:von Willebrand factor type A domain-containing protein [Myxococcota bacterium]|nr:von Willebrand factor type A domain-containing protein [Myxococcota bacterium]MBU1899316.1 von Willebrand factor type A domain-containing protein [Myxococcota bacterium]